MGGRAVRRLSCAISPCMHVLIVSRGWERVAAIMPAPDAPTNCRGGARSHEMQERGPGGSVREEHTAMRLRGLRLEIILTAQPLGKHRADAQVSGGEEPLAPARRRQTAEEGAEPARPPRETRRGEGHTRSQGRGGG